MKNIFGLSPVIRVTQIMLESVKSKSLCYNEQDPKDVSTIFTAITIDDLYFYPAHRTDI
jgi:hypothetical protein